MYCVLIGDIIDSRLLNNRFAVQDKYINVLEEINKEFDSYIASRFRIRDGDGFHGLLNSPEVLFDIILKIRLALAPVQIRIGIGIGDINIEIKRYALQEMDGEVFNIARDAMDYAKDKEDKYESIFQYTALRFLKNASCQTVCELKEQEAIEDLINLVFCNCSIIERKWSTKQIEVISLKTKGMTQREIAQKLNISQPAVTLRLKTSDYYTYRYCTKQIQQYLSVLWRK